MSDSVCQEGGGVVPAEAAAAAAAAADCSSAGVDVNDINDEDLLRKLV